jgi:tRNA G18 (ribose-2'-O)-methylase SpoU
MKNLIVLENVRSAYNVGNIIRTAEVLGYDAVILGYTPSPLTHPKVQKTSL